MTSSEPRCAWSRALTGTTFQRDAKENSVSQPVREPSHRRWLTSPPSLLQMCLAGTAAQGDFDLTSPPSLISHHFCTEIDSF